MATIIIIIILCFAYKTRPPPLCPSGPIGPFYLKMFVGKVFVQIPRTQNNIGSCLSLYAVDGSHNHFKTQTNKDKYGSIRTIRANKFTIFSMECFLWTYFILMLTYMSLLTHICPYLYLIIILVFRFCPYMSLMGPYSTLLVKNIRENKPTRNVYRSRHIRTKFSENMME